MRNFFSFPVAKYPANIQIAAIGFSCTNAEILMFEAQIVSELTSLGKVPNETKTKPNERHVSLFRSSPVIWM